MARHHRDAKGVDQHGELWYVTYHPDWMRRVKISRQLPDERRRSRVTLVKNPLERAREEPPREIRTRIRAADGSAKFEVALSDPDGLVDSITVVARRRRGGEEQVLEFVLQDGLAPPRA